MLRGRRDACAALDGLLQRIREVIADPNAARCT